MERYDTLMKGGISRKLGKYPFKTKILIKTKLFLIKFIPFISSLYRNKNLNNYSIG